MTGCISKQQDFDKCPVCKKTMNNLAGNPAKWSVGLFTKDNPGVLTYYCHGCAGKAMDEYKEQEQLKLLTKWI